MVIFTVGIPGSGKSTWIKNNFNLTDPSITRINADAIRFMLYGDENTQGSGKKVFEIVYSLFVDALENESVDTIIVDNTNINYQTRKNFYKLIDEFGVNHKIKLVVFTNHEKAIERNQSRDRVVPDDVLIKMIDKFDIHESEQSFEIEYIDD